LFGPPAYSLPATNSSTNHLERVVALIAQGDLKGAEKEARLALAKPSTRALAYATLGTIRLQQKKLAESSQYLAKAIQLDPKLVGARLTLGQVYARQGKTARARQTFQQALELAPDNPAVRVNLAQLEAMSGNYKASLELIEPIAPPLRRSPDGLVLLVIDYLGLGQKDSARELVSDWMALGEGVPPALAIEFAKPLVEQGLVPEAIQVLEKARGTGPASFELAFTLGGAYLASGDTKRASEYYERAATLNDRCALCFRQMAKIARREGEKEKALSFLIKAKALEPENPEVLFEFGRLCLEGDLFRDAIAALERAVQLRPDNDQYRYVLGSAYVGKVRYEEALPIFDALVKKHPEDPVLNYAMGAMLYTVGMDLEGAEKYLRMSIHLQPNQVGAYYYLGMVIFKKGDQDQAVGIFHELLQRFPDHVGSLEQLGTILVKQRKYDEAQQVLEKVLRLDPDSLTGHYQYSLLLGRLGKREESEKHMQIAKRLEDERKVTSKREFYLLNPH
jgi:tetratricopeptide (TPR) repeat protein